MVGPVKAEGPGEESGPLSPLVVKEGECPGETTEDGPLPSEATGIPGERKRPWKRQSVRGGDWPGPPPTPHVINSCNKRHIRARLGLELIHCLLNLISKICPDAFCHFRKWKFWAGAFHLSLNLSVSKKSAFYAYKIVSGQISYEWIIRFPRDNWDVHGVIREQLSHMHIWFWTRLSNIPCTHTTIIVWPIR